MIVARIQDDMIVVDAPPTVNELVKTIPGATWKRNVRKWALPLTWASCVMLRGTFRDELAISQELSDWAWAEKERRIEPAMRLRELKEHV